MKVHTPRPGAHFGGACRHHFLVGMALIPALLLGAGCSRSDTPSQPPPSTGSGFLTVAIHDDPPPVPQATQLMVSIAKIRLRTDGGSWVELPANPAPFDLLTLKNGRDVAALTNAPVPAGTYTELRLVFAGNPLATIDGKAQPVPVKDPSCDTSGCKIKGTLTIAPNMCTKISVDFQQALKGNPKHEIMLHPVLLIDRSQTIACSNIVPPDFAAFIAERHDCLQRLATKTPQQRVAAMVNFRDPIPVGEASGMLNFFGLDVQSYSDVLDDFIGVTHRELAESLPQLGDRIAAEKEGVFRLAASACQRQIDRFKSMMPNDPLYTDAKQTVTVCEQAIPDYQAKITRLRAAGAVIREALVQGEAARLFSLSKDSRVRLVQVETCGD